VETGAQLDAECPQGFDEGKRAPGGACWSIELSANRTGGGFTV
jgi:hypothetical protein